MNLLSGGEGGGTIKIKIIMVIDLLVAYVEVNKMNKQYVLKRIQPYLNDNGKLGEDDFNNLFSKFEKTIQYEIINVLIEEKIEIDYENTKLKRKKEVTNSVDSREVKKSVSSLSNEQLCVLYQQGYKLALDYLIEKNSKLIWSKVRKYSNRYKHKLDDDDLFQFGVMGFIQGVKRFENNKNFKFTTYATWWITQVILRGIADYGFTVRIPVHLFEQVNSLNRAIILNSQCSSKEEIYNLLRDQGMTREKFEELINIRENILSVSSLNVLIGEKEDSELEYFIEDYHTPTVEEQVEYVQLKETIRNVLNTISEREEKVINLRFGLDGGTPKTLEEVGKEFKVTRERIRQIEAKALRKLRHPSRSKQLRDFI